MLDKILEKLGIKKFDELTPEERTTYLQWSQVLGTTEPNLEDIKKALASELERARIEAGKYENSKEKDLFFKAYLHLLETLHRIIFTPVAERQALRSYLQNRFPDLEI